MCSSRSTIRLPAEVATRSGPERLQRVIARSGLTSRRGADDLIVAGRVSVDGEVASPGRRVDAATVEVLVDGLRLPVDPGLVYYALHKPLGVISTTRDPQGRRTVTDLVPPNPPVYPVGRLDADSTGLLLLTNDGDFANLVTHPRYGITKTYQVMVEGLPTRRDMALLRHGVQLEDGPARVLTIRKIGDDRRRSHLEVTMGEGRNREVRRMFAALGFPVVHLHRNMIGPLRERNLTSGDWRHLEMEEVRAFYRHVGTRDDHQDNDHQGTVRR